MAGGMLNRILSFLKRPDFIMELQFKINSFIQLKIGYINGSIATLSYRNKRYKKLKQKYSYFLSSLSVSVEPYLFDSEVGGNRNVWILWLQGIEEAPEIVKLCFNSVCYHLKDSSLHLITRDNLNNYISIPEYIIEKWEIGKMSNAHFSDIVRTILLCEYGGLWLDATVFLTDCIPTYVYKKRLFLLQSKLKDDQTISKNNWFIYSQKRNRTMIIIKELLFEYWKNEEYQMSYFLWQHFCLMALERYPEDNNDIYYVSEEMAHDLSYCLYKPYDEEYFSLLKSWSPYHKLSYRIFHTVDWKPPTSIDGTFYERIQKELFELVGVK